MNIRLINALILICLFGFFNSCTKGQKDNTYDLLKSAFLNPPDETRPKVYWWCLNGNIDTARARQEFIAMKNTGITGFDLFEIGVPKQDTMIPGGPAFLSDKSLEMIKFAVDEAGKLGLTVGLNLASSWNAGGSWTAPEQGGKSLYFSRKELKGTKGKQNIILPFPKISFPKEQLIGGSGKPMIPFQKNGRPVYYEEIAVLAIPSEVASHSLDTADIIDVTPFFDYEKDVLNWDVPDGNWEIYRYVCSNSGQQLVLPSPQSAGLTIDHFDSTAVESHLLYIINRLKPVLGDFSNTALKSFYLASYEARGFVWTSSLPSEFRKVNGYDIRKFIPSLFDPELFDEETTKKTQAGFKKTLSELMINNLYKKSKEICNRYGLKINSEAGGPGYPLYNGPAEPLKAQGSLDIPRGEFWINHSRFYREGQDSIDILRVVKEVSAASHIYERGIVEEEAFTSFQHWQEGPFDMKPQGDRAFCEGMNRVVFHGFSHNITGSGYPGFVYGAGTHFNDKRVWWPKVKPFVDYLARISAVFREADFMADVLWYYGDKVPNSATPRNTHFKAGPGYDYEVINTEILLNNLSVKNNKLTLTNGSRFSLLVLEYEDTILPAVQNKLNELAGHGAVIVSERYPETGEMLQDLGVFPDINYSGIESGLLDFIHYRKNEIDLYFIRNTANEWISRNVCFRQQDKTPEIWNPVSGDIIPVTIFSQDKKGINIPLTLPPYGSFLVIFKKSAPRSHYSRISMNEQHPWQLEFTREGICFLENGRIELEKGRRPVQIDNRNSTFTVEGSWEVSFAEEWGAPEKVTFPELISWTDSEVEGIKYYSGTATYRKSFLYDGKSDPAENEKIYLDLGEISKVGEVWLNGTHLGITWSKPYRFGVTGILKQGENTITIEIANVWSNRLKGDALTGQKFTNTNIKSTIIPAPTIETGDQTRIPWADVPLIKSGLLGPVTIVTYKPVKQK